MYDIQWTGSGQVYKLLTHGNDVEGISVGVSVGSDVVGMSVGSYVVGGSLKDCSKRFETLSLVSDTIEDTEKMCKQ